MNTEKDLNLAHLLDCYQISDASPALLERIMARVQAKKRVRTYRSWVKSAASLAATAIIGFWLGNMSLQSMAYHATTKTADAQRDASEDINLDKVILGPKSFNEVML